MAELYVPTTVLDAQKPKSKWLAAIPENAELSAGFTAGLDAFKVEKSLQSDIDKLKAALSSR